MSWTLFKSNIIRKTNPFTTNNTPPQVATIWATEYDACVKRGRDFINLESVQTGNKSIMETLFKVALLKGAITPTGEDFSLVNEFGNGVKAYWGGAQMNPFPIPLIPAPGSIQNLSVNSNVVIKTGTWPNYPPLKPANKMAILIDQFILAATIHLFTIGGFIQTTSLYPSVPSPIPSPGIINWTGYFILPAIPIPNPKFPSEDGSEPPSLELSDSDISITEESGNSNIGNENIGNDNVVDELLNGDTSLENIISVTLPSDITDAFDVNEYIKNFEAQQVIDANHCD